MYFTQSQHYTVQFVLILSSAIGRFTPVAIPDWIQEKIGQDVPATGGFINLLRSHSLRRLSVSALRVKTAALGSLRELMTSFLTNKLNYRSYIYPH